MDGTIAQTDDGLPTAITFFMRKDAILGKIRIEYIDNLLLFLNS